MEIQKFNARLGYYGRHSSKSLARAILNGRINNMDAIRFFAAFLVIVSHSFAISGFPEPTIGSFTLGKIGVAIFFSLSGFLIASSWDNHPRFLPFMGKRVLRIIPGLAGATLFTVFVIGLIFTSLPAKEYLLSAQTIEYLNNFLVYGMASTLPGVFSANPIPNVVNGSLWTLPYEFTAYLLIALLGITSIIKKWRVAVIILGGLVVLGSIPSLTQSSLRIPFIEMQIGPLFMLSGYFFAGSLLYKLRSQIILNGWIAVLSIAVFFLFSSSPVGYILSVVSISYSTLVVAYSPSINLINFGKRGDVSYGLYIYAFPVQQAVVVAIPKADPLDVFLISFPLTFFLALVSWKLIEYPALKLKWVFSDKRYPRTRLSENQDTKFIIRSI